MKIPPEQVTIIRRLMQCKGSFCTRECTLLWRHSREPVIANDINEQQNPVGLVRGQPGVPVVRTLHERGQL